MDKKKVISLCMICFMMMCLSACSKKSEVSLISNEKAISIINESGLVERNVSKSNYDLFYPYVFSNLQSAYDIKVTLYEDGKERMIGRSDKNEVEEFFLAFTFQEDSTYLMNYYMDSKENHGYVTSTPHSLKSGNETYTEFFLEEYEIKEIDETQYLGILDFTGRTYHKDNFQEDVAKATQSDGCVITLEIKKSEK